MLAPATSSFRYPVGYYPCISSHVCLFFLRYPLVTLQIFGFICISCSSGCFSKDLGFSFPNGASVRIFPVSCSFSPEHNLIQGSDVIFDMGDLFASLAWSAGANTTPQSLRNPQTHTPLRFLCYSPLLQASNRLKPRHAGRTIHLKEHQPHQKHRIQPQQLPWNCPVARSPTPTLPANYGSSEPTKTVSRFIVNARLRV